ncbi:hypothetical protein [Alloyangia pacifica]|uniref:Uncharacterized protein n=1 Tax=Alloyangia pacifica TaxID=311180 RepID=A0A1I6NYJ7_9RHOB|nr:hypothetical protein [Alloyangia pacifica]SDH56753.1 hypothetical protein SAMN04488245_108114 [Alloyangia pacifica]SFS33036.1 hypothetical protein SAMN04488050_101189 [Alloyangia pacifica]
MAVQLAHLYVTLCLARLFFHVALILGAPLARWAPGGGPDGGVEGKAGAGPKALSALAILVLLIQASAMLVVAGFPGTEGLAYSGMAIWIAVGLPVAELGLGLPSRAEADKWLWRPLDLVMAALSLAVLSA